MRESFFRSVGPLGVGRSWSAFVGSSSSVGYLTDGDPEHTLVQVAVNDLIMLVAFAPIVMFLCGVRPTRQAFLA